MDDRFMNELRRDPDPVFARTLRQKLRDLEPATPDALRGLRWMPALATAAAVVVVGLLVALPQARDTALAFLDMFRVRQFVAVGVDENRIKQIKDRNLDLAAVLGSVEGDSPIHSAGPSQAFTSVTAAAAIAGYMPKAAYDVPTGLLADTVWVVREASGQMTLHMDKLRDIVQALDLRGVDVPMQLDGQTVTVRQSVIVRQHFSGSKGRRAVLVQSRSPEIGLPPGADLAQLGEIGLRIMGLDATEAQRFARSIDWRGTVVVPVPTTSSQFRDVDVNGHKALMVSGSQREGTMILWSEDGMVYAVCGNVEQPDLLQMANSVR